ncbi:hypothetical protein ANN_24180 [Periplaneta americana]|uniref:Carbonic anhydrase n=1 Tax=Periplaneta americana TaxID=6978 RepID=A0ABQ8S2U4_PERAM|nr:hypothetical protein ANN_24180 [Periplaneta americana]
MILARASIAAAVCLCQLFVATGGLVYHYGGRAEDLLLPPATSWYNLWVPGPSDPVLLYVQQPPPLSPLPLMVDQHSSQGRYTHSRALGQHPHPHRGGKHFGYSRHNGAAESTVSHIQLTILVPTLIALQNYNKYTSRHAASTAELAMEKKVNKYAHLLDNYIFVPFAVETFGPWSHDASTKKIGNVRGFISGRKLAVSRKYDAIIIFLDKTPYERIPNLTGEQSDGITVFRIPPMTSMMLHRCRTGAINLQRWWQSPSAAISESDWFLYRAGISRRITSCTVVSWRRHDSHRSFQQLCSLFRCNVTSLMPPDRASRGRKLIREGYPGWTPRHHVTVVFQIAILTPLTCPDVWPLDYPQCGGSKQSPINLESNDMYRLVVPEQLQWHGYWTRPRNLTLVNNGHTIQVSGSWGSRDLSPWISGGPLDGEYKFSQLHFHWGSDDSIGSEHTVSNVSFPMEMHLVHYKKAYGSQEEATKYEDGLAVVSFLFQTSDRPNPALNAIIPFMDAVVGAELEVTLSRPFPLEMLDISFPSDYVTYLGSLTTPPCSEVVTWIVSSRPLTISHSQLSKFRHLSSADGEMENNFRPVQPTNGRPVFYVS